MWPRKIQEENSENKKRLNKFSKMVKKTSFAKVTELGLFGTVLSRDIWYLTKLLYAFEVLKQ